MHERLSSLDASLLYSEQLSTPLQVGSVMIFTPGPHGFSYESLLDLVGVRIAEVPRYRQRVREVPGRIAAPLWIDDDQFDVEYHVRRSALPRPGTVTQLEEFVARIQARPLDRDRPLWEIYLVEGLESGRFALVTKSHQALVDGRNAVDLAQLLIDADPTRAVGPAPQWRSVRAPSDIELFANAALDVARSPGAAVRGVREAATGVGSVAGQALSVMGGAAGLLARSVSRPAPESPLNRPVGARRRYVMVESELGRYQAVRNRLVADADDVVTVHAVVLATITGALRAWLMTRGEGMSGTAKIRALVPLGFEAQDGGAGVVPCFVDLPVGEPAPMMRVQQIAYDLQQQVQGGTSARALTRLSGLAPPTFHALGSRLGSAVSRRMFNVVITNVPGPQQPLYLADAEMMGVYPVIPLTKNRALAIGLTSYNAKVCFGLNGDREAMPDLELFGQFIEDALTELAHEGAAR